MMTDTEIGGVLLRLRGRIAEVGVMHCEVGGLMGIDPTRFSAILSWSAEDAKAFRGCGYCEPWARWRPPNERPTPRAPRFSKRWKMTSVE